MNFIIKYLQTELKSNPWLFFKITMLLVPILSIVAMFATAQLVPFLNQKNFIENSRHEWIFYRIDEPAEPAYYRVMDNITVADIISTDPAIHFGPLGTIDIFLAEDLDLLSEKNSYFNPKNVLDGDIGCLSAEDGSIGLALDYSSAKTLGKKIGDQAFLIIDREDEITYYPFIIQAILKPYRTEWGGLGLARIDSSFLKFVNEHGLDYCFAQFGDGEKTPSVQGRVVYKKDQMSAALAAMSLHRNKINLVIAVMGIIVIFLLINREVKFYINRKMRTIGILSALGATVKIIYNTFWVVLALKIVISSLMGGIIYKYLLMECFIGEYIAFETWLLIVLIYIFIGLSSLWIAMRRIGVALRDSSVKEIISKKPEGW